VLRYLRPESQRRRRSLLPGIPLEQLEGCRTFAPEKPGEDPFVLGQTAGGSMASVSLSFR